MREISGIYMHGMGTVKGKDEKFFTQANGASLGDRLDHYANLTIFFEFLCILEGTDDIAVVDRDGHDGFYEMHGIGCLGSGHRVGSPDRDHHNVGLDTLHLGNDVCVARVVDPPAFRRNDKADPPARPGVEGLVRVVGRLGLHDDARQLDPAGRSLRQSEGARMTVSGPEMFFTSSGERWSKWQ
jgi:hypothetical protein